MSNRSVRCAAALLAISLLAACEQSAISSPNRVAPQDRANHDAAPAVANLVVNGSFEQPSHVPNPYPWQTFNTGSTGLTGWTIESGSVDTQAGDWNGSSAYLFTGIPDGSQVLDMNTASISQTLATTPGLSYHISFSMSENYVILHGGTVTMQVQFGGTTQSFSFSDATGSATNMRWDAHGFDAIASTSSTTLRFSVTGGANGSGGPFLDAVQVQVPSVFTSGSNVQTWDPIFPATADPTWPSTSCTTTPAIGINASWVNPHNAFVVGGHPWADSYFSAPWINAWNSLPSQGPDGQSYTKYQTTVSGNGTFVVQLLADNCSWVYLDNTLVGVQNTDLSKHAYSLTLNGPATLTYIIFDGGGAAGGKFRLETLQSYVDNGGDPSLAPPLPPVDNTAPVITPTVAGTAGSNGWYTSDVNVAWSVTDAESAISSKTGCDVTSVTSNTAGTTFTCSATSAGGTSTKSVTIKRDDSAPVITPTVTGTQVGGWYTSNVGVHWTVSDAESGIGSSTGCDDVTLSQDSNGTTYTCNATNGAGLSNSQSVTVKRDATPPSVAFSGNAGTYTVDQSVGITCAASDAMSGLASSTCANTSGDAYTFGLGSHSLSASAIDNAGNSAATSATFTVSVTSGSLCTLVKRWVTQAGVANSMCQELANGAYGAFRNHVSAQSGKFVSADHAATLIALSNGL